MKKYSIDNLDNVNASDKVIEFTSNGEYNLEILDDDFSLDVVVKDNVSVKLFIFGKRERMESKINYRLGKSSGLLLFKFYNIMEVLSIENIYLDGEYSSISYNFSSICNGREDYKISVFHNNNCVSSYINNNCIGNDKSSIKFDIDSILDKGNIGCVMDQNTKIISMGDVDTCVNPNMFIEEDDVVARHGSVIGKFNDEDIFYLMSRGISEVEAVRLLIRGFILSNLVVSMDSRSKILACINDNFY